MPVHKKKQKYLNPQCLEIRMVKGSVWDKMRMKRSVLKILPQRGQIKSIPRDAGRKAKLPGKRISKTGKEYWETRKNRSDAVGKRL